MKGWRRAGLLAQMQPLRKRSQAPGAEKCSLFHESAWHSEDLIDNCLSRERSTQNEIENNCETLVEQTAINALFVFSSAEVTLGQPRHPRYRFKFSDS